jgi:hypothetical protein
LDSPATVLGGKLDLFKCCSRFFEHGEIISLASIDQSRKFDTVFRQAALPVFALDPDATHGTPIKLGHLKGLSHMTRRTCFR